MGCLGADISMKINNDSRVTQIASLCLPACLKWLSNCVLRNPVVPWKLVSKWRWGYTRNGSLPANPFLSLLCVATGEVGVWSRLLVEFTWDNGEMLLMLCESQSMPHGQRQCIGAQCSSLGGRE